MKILKSTGSKDLLKILGSRIQKIGFGDILEDEEEVIETVFRRMFYRTFMRALIWFCLFVYTGGLWIFFFRTSIWVYIGIASIGYGFYRMFYTVSYWYLNAIVMTTHNLIFVSWHKFFHRKTTRLDYWNLDEIEVERTGLASYFYHYGTLHFYKANGGELYSFTQCHAPNKVAKSIETYRQRLVDTKNIQEESTLKGILSGMVQRHLDEHGADDLSDYDTGKIIGQKMRESHVKFKEQIKKEKEPLHSRHEQRFDLREQFLERKPAVFVSKEKEEQQRTRSWFSRHKKTVERVERDQIEIEVEKRLDDEGGISIDL